MTLWQWRGNQLYNPTTKQTILRDVLFWNCTTEDKRLIAAAPDMLAALQAYIAWAAPVCDTPDLRPIREQMKAAVDKATGETQ